MQKKVVDLPQSMKYMVEHGEWQRMMEVKEKILSGFNAPVQGRKGLQPINSPRTDRKVSFTIAIMFLLAPSNILSGVIMPHY